MELMKGRLVDYLLSVRFLFIYASQVGKTGGLLAKCEISLHFCK